MLLRRTTTLTLLLSLLGVFFSATSHACILPGGLFVTIVDADSLDRIENGVIYLEPSTYPPLTDNVDGVYAFPAMADGYYTIDVEADCYLPEQRSFHLTCGQIKSLVVYMDRVTYPIPSSPHTADQNGDGVISLQELLRVIQIYNSDEYHCNSSTEDGYDLGPGPRNCTHHDADYDSTKWTIGLSEVTRMVQLYNSGGYHSKSGTEDGFAPNVCTW